MTHREGKTGVPRKKKEGIIVGDINGNRPEMRREKKGGQPSQKRTAAGKSKRRGGGVTAAERKERGGEQRHADRSNRSMSGKGPAEKRDGGIGVYCQETQKKNCRKKLQLERGRRDKER